MGLIFSIFTMTICFVLLWQTSAMTRFVFKEKRTSPTPAIEKAIKNPELKARLEKMNLSVDYKSPSEMKKLITEEYGTVNAIAQKSGLAK